MNQFYINLFSEFQNNNLGFQDKMIAVNEKTISSYFYQQSEKNE